MFKIKLKKCKQCGNLFTPTYSTTQVICGYNCAITYGLAKKVEKDKKDWAKEKKERKEALMNHSDWLKIFQVIFNEFIRLRDKGLKCISCPNKNPSDAGHYKSRGANPELAFNEFNTNLQCRKCNGYWGGNIIEYRKGLIEKYGLEITEWLEGPHEVNKLSIPEIKNKIQEYKQKIKELKLKSE